MEQNQKIIAGVIGLAIVGLALWFFLGRTEEPVADAGICKTSADCKASQECCGGTCKAEGECATDNTPSSTQKTSTTVAQTFPSVSKRSGLPLHKNRTKPEEPKLPVGEIECESNTDCSSGLIRCDASTKRCVESPICVRDSDCAGDRVCAQGKCTSEVPKCRATTCNSHCIPEYDFCEPTKCQADSDCAGPRRCFNKDYCVDCIENSDCEGNQRCVEGAHYCVDAEVCEANIDCVDGNLCNKDNGKCTPPECTKDEFEPNDSRRSPAILEPGTYSLTNCPQDTDYYELSVDAGDGFVVHVEYDPTPGDIEIDLKDAGGEESGLMTGDRTGSVVLQIDQVVENTTYLLRVRSRQLKRPIPYSLRYHNVSGGFCVNERFLEPNDTLKESLPILQGHVFSNVLCPEEEDWFRYKLRAGQTLEVKITTEEFADAPEEPINIEFFDLDKEEMVASDRNDVLTKYINLTSEEQETEYAIRVFSDIVPVKGLEYDIKLTEKGPLTQVGEPGRKIIEPPPLYAPK